MIGGDVRWRRLGRQRGEEGMSVLWRAGRVGGGFNHGGGISR